MRPEFQGYFKDNFAQPFTPCFPLNCPDQVIVYSQGYTKTVPQLADRKLIVGNELSTAYHDILAGSVREVNYNPGAAEVIDITWGTILTDPVVYGNTYQYAVVVVQNDICKSERYEKAYDAIIPVNNTVTANTITNALINVINNDPNKKVIPTNNAGKLRLTALTPGQPFYVTGITLGTAARISANIYPSGGPQMLLECGGKEDTGTPGNGVIKTSTYKIVCMSYLDRELLGAHGDMRVSGALGAYIKTVWIGIDTNASVTATVWTNALEKILKGQDTAAEYAALIS